MTMVSDKCMYKECDGTGLIHVIDSNLESLMRICRCRKDREVTIKLQSANIPLDFIECSVENFEIEVYKDKSDKQKAKFVKHAASKFVENYDECKSLGKGLYLFSEMTGSGKSRLAVSIANDLIKKYNLNVLYTSSIDIFTEIKKTFGSDSEYKEHEVLKAYKMAELLIIDDFGVEKSSEWAESIFTQILEERMNNRKLTIFTSNIHTENLSKKFPMGRVQSRIQKMTFPLAMPEESIRLILSEKDNYKLFEEIFSKDII
ncbi:ATP-binding protein [Metaplanococcus flavidus]|uniref:ATP-binding protein n=1 Tax=Metaplanococcus flavidus TaxID=569883 RepID=A0ABW3LHP8_9BACL